MATMVFCVKIHLIEKQNQTFTKQKRVGPLLFVTCSQVLLKFLVDDSRHYNQRKTNQWEGTRMSILEKFASRNARNPKYSYGYNSPKDQTVPIHAPQLESTYQGHHPSWTSSAPRRRRAPLKLVVGRSLHG